jgi:hypothetical protein
MQIGLRLVISDTKQLGPRRLRLAGGSMEAWHGRVSATAELSVVRCDVGVPRCPDPH